MHVAVDTNVLAYAEGLNGAAKKRAALDLMAALPPESTLLPVQVLGELFSALVKKGGWPRAKARDAVIGWGDSFPLIETSPSILLSALELTARHQLSAWDSVILAASAEAGCRLLLSEDLQDGFTWSGVTVTNPFAENRHPMLAAFLATS